MERSLKSKRWLYMSPCFWPSLGGVQSTGLDICKELLRCGDTVTAVTSRIEKEWPASELVDGVSVHRLYYPKPRFLGTILNAFVLIWYLLIRRREYDCVISCFEHYQSSVVSVVGKLIGKTVIVRPECGGYTGCVATLKRHRLYKLFRWCLRKADYHVAISKEIEGELISNGWPSGRIVRIPTPVNLQKYCPVDDTKRQEIRKILGLPLNELLVIFFGRLSLVKGLYNLIQAWCVIEDNLTNVRLLIVGDGEEKDGINRELQLRGCKFVSVIGRKNNIADYLKACDVFVLPSFAEGMPASLLETAASGLCAVCSNVGGIPEVLTDGVSGKLIQPNDPEALAKALISVLADSSLRHNLALEARKAVEEKFDLMHIVSSYRSLASNQKSKSNGGVVCVVPSLDCGGAERSTVRLINAVADEGSQITLVNLRGDDTFTGLVQPNVKLVELKCKRVRKGIGAFFRFMQDTHPNVIISHMGHLSAMILWLRKLTGLRAKVICVQHNSLSADNGGSRIFDWLINRSYRMADAVVGVSQGISDELLTKCSLQKNRVHTIYPAIIEPALFELSEQPIPDDMSAVLQAPWVLAVGGLIFRKGFDDLIDAMAIINRKFRCQLIILGKGQLKAALLEHANAVGLADRVFLPGVTQNPYAFMSKCSAFVLSSTGEGFPAVLVEAMACGAPVVATRCPTGPEEIVQNGEDGLLVPMNDPASMADAIEKILTDDALARSLSENARNRVRDCSGTIAAQRFVQLAEDVVRR